jgi:hypothetical protein
LHRSEFNDYEAPSLESHAQLTVEGWAAISETNGHRDNQEDGRQHHQ